MGVAVVALGSIRRMYNLEGADRGKKELWKPELRMSEDHFLLASEGGREGSLEVLLVLKLFPLLPTFPVP